MKHFNGLFISILIAFGWPMTAQQFGAAQADKPQAAEIRINHDVLVENQRLEFIFLDILRGTALRGGFVEMAVCSDLPHGQLQIKQGITIGQAMDALVAANPDYQWELKDGVVNLMPRVGPQLLSVKIATLQIDATNQEMQAELQNVLRHSEVRERQAALGLKDGIHHGGAEAIEEHPGAKEPIPVHINLQNLSLQDAFNKIVESSPDGVWIYRETDCKGAKTYTVDMASSY